MELAEPDIYRLKAEQLRQCCEERGLSSAGPVRALRRRLVGYVRAEMADPEGETKVPQASVTTELLPDRVITPSPVNYEVSRDGCVGTQFPVLSELLRQVKPLVSEEPADILQLFVRLDEVYELKLVDDKQFITKILPLVFGSLLKFLGECRREESSWAECKSRLLEEYFPYFVRERLVRDLVIFKFHGAGESIRLYVDQVFQAANLLKNGATEQQLVDRVLMNLSPEVLAQSAFLERPRSRRDLYKIMGLIEEKISVTKERQRVEYQSREVTRKGEAPPSVSREVPHNYQQRAHREGVKAARCWGCGRLGHLQRQCYARIVRSGNGRRPGGQVAPGGSS